MSVKPGWMKALVCFASISYVCSIASALQLAFDIFLQMFYFQAGLVLRKAFQETALTLFTFPNPIKETGS